MSKLTEEACIQIADMWLHKVGVVSKGRVHINEDITTALNSLAEAISAGPFYSLSVIDRLTAAPQGEPATDGALSCTGCGSTQTIEEIRAQFPGAISCCPDRDMQPTPAAEPAVGDEVVGEPHTEAPRFLAQILYLYTQCDRPTDAICALIERRDDALRSRALPEAGGAYHDYDLSTDVTIATPAQPEEQSGRDWQANEEALRRRIDEARPDMQAIIAEDFAPGGMMHKEPSPAAVQERLAEHFAKERYFDMSDRRALEEGRVDAIALMKAFPSITAVRIAPEREALAKWYAEKWMDGEPDYEFADALLSSTLLGQTMPSEEDLAEAMFKDDHAGMKNCWEWDDAELEAEHPGTRYAYLKRARGAIAFIRDRK